MSGINCATGVTVREFARNALANVLLHIQLYAALPSFVLLHFDTRKAEELSRRHIRGRRRRGTHRRTVCAILRPSEGGELVLRCSTDYWHSA